MAKYKEFTDILRVEGINCKGYGIIPKAVMLDQRLTIQAKAIYAYFRSFAGAGTVAFPSVSKICYDLGFKTKDTFYKHRKLLEKYGYIKVEQKRDKGKFTYNIYTLPEYPVEEVEELEELEETEEAEETLPNTDVPEFNDNTLPYPKNSVSVKTQENWDFSPFPKKSETEKNRDGKKTRRKNSETNNNNNINNNNNNINNNSSNNLVDAVNFFNEELAKYNLPPLVLNSKSRKFADKLSKLGKEEQKKLALEMSQSKFTNPISFLVSNPRELHNLLQGRFKKPKNNGNLIDGEIVSTEPVYNKLKEIEIKTSFDRVEEILKENNISEQILSQYSAFSTLHPLCFLEESAILFVIDNIKEKIRKKKKAVESLEMGI